MSRLNDANVRAAPRRSSAATRRPRSATIPLLHLAQQQDGYVTNEAMAHIAELVGATSAEVLRHGDVLRDVQVRAGRQVPDQHLRHDVVRAAGRRRADAPRRAAPRHQGRRHHARRSVHAGTTPSARRRAPRRRACRSTTATATGSPPSSSTHCRRPRAPAGSTARSRRTARVATVRQQHPGRPGRRRRRRPTTSPTRRPGSPTEPPERERMTTAGTTYPWAPGFVRRRPAADRHRRASSTRTRYTLERYLATGGYEGLRPRWPSRRPTCTTRSRTPPCSAVAAPASRPA